MKPSPLLHSTLHSALCILHSALARLSPLLMLTLPLFPSTATADEPLILERGNVRVSFTSGDVAPARQAAAAMEDATALIRTKLGVSFESPVQVRIVRGRDEFNRLIGERMPDWVMAVALPPNEILVDAVKVTPGTEDNLRLTVIHEATHLALDGIDASPRRLPRWFHEGVATWVSGVEHLSADWSGFNLAVAQKALPKLKSLEETFPAEARRANVAYLVSASFVRYLVREHGEDAIRWVLDEYRSGKEFHAAFRDALGETVEKAQSEWHGSLRRSFPWLRALVSSISFWSVVAVCTILVFLVVRRRRNRQHEEWERQEREWHVVGSEDDGPDEPTEDVYDGPDDDEDDF